MRYKEVVYRETDLLPQLQNLEALEVVELPPLLELNALLCPGALVELGVHLGLLPLLLEGTDTASTGKLVDHDRSKGDVGESSGVTGDGALLGGSINEHLEIRKWSARIYLAKAPYTLVVDDLDDGCQATVVLAAVEADDPPNLDVPPRTGRDFCGHCCGVVTVVLVFLSSGVSGRDFVLEIDAA